MRVTITDVVNHGEFLQAFAVVEHEGESREVSFCFKGLPFTEDGVFAALAAKFYEPPAPEPAGEKKEPASAEMAEPVTSVPDPERAARVKALENTWKKLPKAGKTVVFPEAGEVV